MKSTAEHPLAFFDWYLENEVNKDLKEFYEDITEKFYYNNVIEVSEDKQFIKVVNIHHQDIIKSKHITIRFEGSIKGQFKEEINISKKFIELGFQKRFSDKKEVKAYADFLRIKLNQYNTDNKTKNFPFLINYFESLNNLIEQYSINTDPIQYLNNLSFNILSDSNDKQLIKIEKLYDLLIKEPSLIESNKVDFINAFSGKEIDQGINWMVIAKNKFTSKTSLFYFIDELIKKKHLKSTIINDLNKHIKYVFRDYKGNKLNNLKQSKATYSKNVTQQERIDSIISSL